MQLHRTSLVLSLALLAGNAAAQSPNPAETGALPVPANRIVGFWKASVNAGPCQGGPTVSFTGFNTYHAGGTLSESGATSVTNRGPGHGTWKYLGAGRYKSRLQFNRFLPDGTFDGVQDIRGRISLNAHATQFTNIVYARVLNADGSLRVELCGVIAGERIGID